MTKARQLLDLINEQGQISKGSTVTFDKESVQKDNPNKTITTNSGKVVNKARTGYLVVVKDAGIIFVDGKNLVK